MNVEHVEIDSLSPDPANVRVHNPKNLEAIKSSLRRFGQQKPIVVDQRGIVRAGNGTLAGAKALGWKQISIVRTELSGAEATAYAIADNRTGELAEWDEDALAAELGGLAEEGLDLSELGFDQKDLAKLLNEELPGGDEPLGQEKWLVVVTCKDEADQVKFLEQMGREGRESRALLG